MMLGREVIKVIANTKVPTWNLESAISTVCREAAVFVNLRIWISLVDDGDG
jgi:hypothetical protein